MVTKLEILALYNTERGTNFTLTTLATTLLEQVLKEQYKAHLIKQIQEPEIV